MYETDPDTHTIACRLPRDAVRDAARREYTEEERRALRPIAETLAMIDGNAFFTMRLNNDEEWYTQYLPEAAVLFERNGGIDGWAGLVSWLRD